jgi:arginyl-tRNA synthetase
LIEDRLRLKIEKVLAELSLPSDVPIIIERPKEGRFGDFSSPVAFALAKRMGRNPREIASSIARAMGSGGNEVETAEIAGGGFVNFTLSKDFYRGELAKIYERCEEYTKIDIGKGAGVIVEFVSSNPTGPLTVGHGRQAALGDVLSNLLAEAGYRVTREYYFNDAGRQMDLLGRSCYARYRQQFDPSFPFPDDGYRGEYLIRIAERAAEEHGDRFAGPDRDENEAVQTMRKFAARAIVATIDADLKEMGVKFDTWFNESTLYQEGKLDAALETLAGAGALYEKDGAKWFRASRYGDVEDRVLVKSSGEPTYFLTDIAYHIEKHKRQFAWMINIHGADHHGYVPRMKAAMKALGFPEGRLTYLLHQMVTFVENGEEMKMSTRAGAFVTLRDLMEKVGVDATRYFFVMRRSDSHLVFDIDLAKKKNLENPVYYVQYSHARIASVLEKAVERGIDVRSESLAKGFDPEKLAFDDEWALVKLLTDLPSALRDAVVNLEPHRMTDYLERTSSAFHHWYQEGDKDGSRRILIEDIPTTITRLYLAVCAKNVLAKGLSLLGVSCPEKM